MVESWSYAETFAAMEVPQFALVRLVFNDDGASDGAIDVSSKLNGPMQFSQAEIVRDFVYCCRRLMLSLV